MSEQSLGDISHNRIHQTLEVLQSSGFSVDLLHRLRLDKDYRDAFIEQARSLDKDMIGEMLTVNYSSDFLNLDAVLTALKEKSPYCRKHSYLLKDEILIDLWMADIWSSPTQYPLKLYAMSFYKRMTRSETHKELERRGLVSAKAREALCLATCFGVSRDKGPIIVMEATPQNKIGDSMLCFGRNGIGDPMLCLTDEESFDQDTRLLVKRKSV